jgi:uncharacterized protein
MKINLRSFRQKVARTRRSFRRFLTKVENNPPRGLDKTAEVIDKEVWQEIDCLECANCCKQMTPTFTTADLKRISKHLDMTVEAFKEKWLYKDRNGDWMNVKTPCQFLQKDHKCAIYEVRPADCAGFPHLAKKKMTDYMHVHKQNITYCPAAHLMVEKMIERAKG